MPQAKLNRSALPATNRPPAQRGGRMWALPLGAAGLIAVVAAASLTGPGGAGIAAAHRFLEFYSGVFSLVALSITVLIGLAATDRVVLMIRHRVLLQAAHRSFAITAMVFLAVHVATKVMEGHAHTLDVVVPFLASHRAVYVGLGTVASYLMILATWTGMARGRFAGSAHPGLWRTLHATAYASWVVALAHGLESGRSAKTWVWVSYTGCLILAGIALLVRLNMTWSRRLHVARAQTLSATRPVGGTPPAAPAMATDVALFAMDAADPPPEPAPIREYGPARPAIARVPATEVVHVAAAEAHRGQAPSGVPPCRPIESRPIESRPSASLPNVSGPIAPRRWPHGRTAPAQDRHPVSGHAARSSPGPAIPDLPAGPTRPVALESDDDFIAFLRGEEQW
jgi:hypothetical protein